MKHVTLYHHPGILALPQPTRQHSHMCKAPTAFRGRSSTGGGS